jgi:hypothetical protein
MSADVIWIDSYEPPLLMIPVIQSAEICVICGRKCIELLINRN